MVSVIEFEQGVMWIKDNCSSFEELGRKGREKDTLKPLEH